MRTSLACLVAGLALLGASAAQAQATDPNRAAVKEVCGRCHGEEQFMDTPRTWPRWNDVFAEMMKVGASGTDEQLTQVTTYFLDHLTTVNVNTGTEDELVWVLGVREEVALDILARRATKPFKTLDELKAVPGINAARVDTLKPRIQF